LRIARKIRVNAEFGLLGVMGSNISGAGLEHATIKDNILFSSVYDAARYEAVIDACALHHDLEVFDAGDLTGIYRILQVVAQSHEEYWDSRDWREGNHAFRRPKG
jgi:hypothetical protein